MVVGMGSRVDVVVESSCGCWYSCDVGVSVHAHMEEEVIALMIEIGGP